MSESELEQNGRSLNRWLCIGCILFVVAAALHSADQVIGGGDTWVAMECGRFQVNDWACKDQGRTIQMRLLDFLGIHMTQKDPYSAASRPFDPDSARFSSTMKRVGLLIGELLGKTPEEKPGPEVTDFGWINQNWLTHVLFYKMRQWWGENSIVIYKFFQAVFTALFAFWAARVLGANVVLAAAAAGFGILLSRSYVDLRPNVSTIFFSAIMVYLLSLWRMRRNRALFWMIPVMIIWSNVHGGFIYPIMIFWIMVFACLAVKYLGKNSYLLLFLAIGIIAIMFFRSMPVLQDAWRELNSARSGKSSVALQQLLFRMNLIRFCQVSGVLAAVGVLGIGLLILLRIRRFTRESFWQAEKKGLKYLLGFAVIITLIPGIFSPFSWENLFHPFLVATGEEGKLWRDVVEWKPIWDGAGFGNVGYYLAFLWIFALVFIAWWVVFLFKPEQVYVHSRRRTQRSQTNIPWPKIDLGQLGLIASTMLMSLQSRRFVFLGGVVLAPFLAVYIQELIDMLRIRYLHKRQQPLQLPSLSRKHILQLATLSTAAAVLMAAVFILAMWDTYYRPPADAARLSVFRRMVGIHDQPVRAIKFFDLNQVNGKVFNEWTNGGFIAFGQKPDPGTGQPACKVFMDGRAQAAYTLQHFLYWRTLKAVLNKPVQKQVYKSIRDFARQHNFSATEPAFFDYLIGMRNSMYFRRKEFRRNSEYRRAVDDWDRKLIIALSNPQLLENVLQRDRVNVALLSFRRSSALIFNSFLHMKHWRLLYIDDRNTIFFRIDAPENRRLMGKLEDLHFPDDYSRNYTIGFNNLFSLELQRVRQGLEQMMNLPGYDVQAQKFIYNRGMKIKEYNKLWSHFSSKYDEYKAKIDKREDFGRRYNLIAVAHSARILSALARKLSNLAQQDGHSAEAQKYAAFVSRYNSAAKLYEGELEKMRRSFLW